MRELADQGAAILFYSTDYDELIGCCDRVAIMYDGRIVRELAGDELNETNIVASSLNIESATASPRRAGREAGSCLAISRSEIRQNFAFLTAVVLFCVVYLLYHLAHPKGFSSAVLVENSDEAFTLALVAMAQTVPVLAAGLDLSVGALMTMVGCFASYLLSGAPDGTPARARLRRMALRALGRCPEACPACCSASSSASLIGAIAGLINGACRRLRPHPADHRHARDGRDLHRRCALPAAAARRQDRRRPQLGSDQLARRFRFDCPSLQRRCRALVRTVRRRSDSLRAAGADRSSDLDTLQPHGHRAGRIRDRVCRRRRLYVRPRHQPRQDRRLHARRVLRRLRRALSCDPDLVGQRRHSAGRRLYVELDRRRRDRRHLAARRQRRGDRLGVRRADPARHLVLLPRLRHRTAACSRCSRGSFCSPRSASARCACCRVKNTLELFR